MTEFRVVVPASTSNLGPGFDCLGLALDRYLSIEWEGKGGGVIETTGSRPPRGFGNLLDTTLEALGLPPRGTLRVRSEIPVGRGLGSSAALHVGLEVLRRHLAGAPIAREAILRSVVEREGHPDNAAPSLYGGLVVATLDGNEPRVTPVALSDDLGWAYAAPSTPSATGEMRAALPSKVSHGVATRAVGRIATLLPALARGDGETVGWAMHDELHVPYRMERIPGAQEAVEAAIEAGAWGCTLSGAGSGLIAAAPPAVAEGVAAAMAAAFAAVDPEPGGVVRMALRPDREGARWGHAL